MKWMIPIAIVVMALIAIVVVLWVNKKNNEIEIEIDLEDIPLDGSGGSIYYGGDFDEFEYQTDDLREERARKKEERQQKMDKLRDKSKKEISTGREVRQAVNSVVEEEENSLTEEPEATSEEVTEVASETEEIVEGIPFNLNNYEHDKVLFAASTREDAEEAANQIGGKILSYENETALIQINEDVDQLLQRLESQGSSLVFMRKYILN